MKDVSVQLPSLRGPLTSIMERTSETMRLREICSRLAAWSQNMESRLQKLYKPDPNVKRLREENCRLSTDLCRENNETQRPNQVSDYQSTKLHDLEDEVSRMRASLDRRSKEAVTATKDTSELATILRQDRRRSAALLEDNMRRWNRGRVSRHAHRRSGSPVY